MGFFGINKKNKTPDKYRSLKFLGLKEFKENLANGYTTLDNCPEVVAACNRISSLIASMTIYLMANTDKGDVRINNELSRKIDIDPCKTMNRYAWMNAICMNLLLYGNGNSVVFPHTRNGYLASLEPIENHRVSFTDIVGREDYIIVIDGVEYRHDELLHFTLNPDKNHLWLGQGFRISLRSLVDNLGQAQTTKKAFMSSKWKPSIIVKVDALTDEFSSPKGRQRLIDDYISTARAGDPWLIPAEQFQVEQVRPLSLSDLAINEAVELDKRTVAAILGVPTFVLGVGSYNSDEWDSFINNVVRPIAMGIEQELTRKLIISPKMYLKFNCSKLYSYDLTKLSAVFGDMYNKGIVTGNEVRDKLGMEPMEGLDQLIVLENYIPIDDIGNQKKLGGKKNDQ